MSEEDWFFDDPGVPDDEELLRRIPWIPSHVDGFNAQTSERFPTKAAFQRGDPGQGMSVHMVSVVQGHGRTPEDVYDAEEAGTVAFSAEVPRTVGAGVVAILASEDMEPDAVLRAAHAEVRPATFAKNRKEWSLIRDEIMRACRWVVAPERPPTARRKPVT